LQIDSFSGDVSMKTPSRKGAKKNDSM
jgi:hypothetical protein